MIEEKKYKILTISDFPISQSGVARQTRFIIEHLLKTGKFTVISIGVAMHLPPNSRPGWVQEYDKSWLIIPSTRYDNMSLIRQILDTEKPDLVWTMTDPRFYEELYRYSDEVRKQCPLVWNGIWDGYPYCYYNKTKFECYDFIGCINKILFNTLNEFKHPNFAYIPHGAPKEVFKILSLEEQDNVRSKHLGQDKKDAFVVFYNSRNALRKRTGNCVMAFKEFIEGLPEEERKNVFFAANTPSRDPEGQDLHCLIEDFGLKGKIGISEGGKASDEDLCNFYNLSHCTMIQSSEEGFGLSCLESLMCGTPVLAGKTGGVTDQMIDEEAGRTWGILMEPDATTLLGSQTVPYINSHHFNFSKTAAHLRTLYDDWKSDKAGYKNRWAGDAARESCLRRFNLEDVCKTWENVIVEEIKKFEEKQKNKTVSLLEI